MEVGECFGQQVQRADKGRPSGGTFHAPHAEPFSEGSFGPEKRRRFQIIFDGRPVEAHAARSQASEDEDGVRTVVQGQGADATGSG